MLLPQLCKTQAATIKRIEMPFTTLSAIAASAAETDAGDGTDERRMFNGGVAHPSMQRGGMLRLASVRSGQCGVPILYAQSPSCTVML